MTNPAVGVKPMLVSMHLPSRTAARLAPLPRWARITRPFAAAGSPSARQFLHQELIGQTVEAIAVNARRLVASRNRQQTGDTRHVAMKGGVEARHLRQCRMALAERLDQLDLTRQMLRVIRRDAVQFIQQLGVTRSGSVWVIPCTTRCPTAVTDAKTCCASSQSSRKATAER